MERRERRCLSKVVQWFRLQCDGDWEHQNGLSIESFNGGWRVVIDVAETELEEAECSSCQVSGSDEKRLEASIANQRFTAQCGLDSLVEVLALFVACARRASEPYARQIADFDENNSNLDLLECLERWYASRSAFEIGVSVAIKTTDNPGWQIDITSNTIAGTKDIRRGEVNDPGGWCFMTLEPGKFVASCDLRQLSEVLTMFFNDFADQEKR